MSLNGTYAAHQGQAYGAADQNYASHNATAAYSGPQQPASTSQSTSSNGAADIPKDEVGWYFVEQYYTTLSRTPEKLFVSSAEAYVRFLAADSRSSSTTNARNSCLVLRRRRSRFVLDRRYA